MTFSPGEAGEGIAHAGEVVCPICRGGLTTQGMVLTCNRCGRDFSTYHGIADLYVDRTTSELSQVVELANVDHYDRNVENFQENVLRDSDDFYGYERDTLRGLAPAGGTGRILDVGTGTGKILEIAAPFYERLYGVDVSLEMLLAARKVTPRLFRASGLALPFREDYFDVVTAHSVLHHIVDLKGAMQEVCRTLKPGGVFYSDTDASRRFVRRFAWFLEMRRRLKRRLFEGDEETEHLSDYYHRTGLDPEEVREVVLSAGFQDVEVRYHFPPNPDEFTQLLMELDSYHKDVSHYYYFVMIARKG